MRCYEVIERFSKLAQSEKRGWGVGGGDLSHDGKHLILYQGETGHRVGPKEDADTSLPFFHGDLPEGYHQKIKYTINHDNPERPIHGAEVSIPIEVASKHPGLQHHLRYAQEDWEKSQKIKKASLPAKNSPVLVKAHEERTTLKESIKKEEPVGINKAEAVEQQGMAKQAEAEERFFSRLSAKQ